MVTKFVVTLISFVALSLTMIGCEQVVVRSADIEFEGEKIDQETTNVARTGPELPATNVREIDIEDVNDTVVMTERIEPPYTPYTQDMKVLFEEMTLVWLLSEEYARIEAVCAGNGLANIKPSSNGPMVLIPNAGDLTIDGSNVAIKFESDGQITFIPRVQGQRIRVPMDLADKVTGHEVLSLTLDEAMQLLAADKLVWTAKWFGPYGNGHGLPGHVAACDPLYPEIKSIADTPAVTTAIESDSPVPQAEELEPAQYTPDVKVLLEEMTLVRVVAEEYARIDAVCAGVGLNNVKPLADEPMILIPNAGDLSVDGSNVAIKLDSDGQITFIPRVLGERIRVPMDVGDKLTGWEVESLTLDEALQLMTAEKLLWTARWFGPSGNGHGLPGHIAECDPRYIG